ncbi:hypothetical protein B0T18DRAFT_410121 [Schizothecium vesticola]|uniref:Uncharacterized protein n=1 Tax=Schizothecium vesticola TaxID=314040 RepID=A0AA40K4N1_9PEZI|nr:hypothetical protein B0T18DRAFT_410121 [Schizothecium vesticola]
MSFHGQGEGLLQSSPHLRPTSDRPPTIGCPASQYFYRDGSKFNRNSLSRRDSILRHNIST